MSSFNYISKEGDRWDILADVFYGSNKSINVLTDANPLVALSKIIPIGSNIIVPIINNTSVSILTTNLPPWML